MLEQLGWNLPDADEYGENVAFREINEAWMRSGRFDPRAAEALLRGLPAPWVLKDPRFVWSADQWKLEGAALLWIRRDAAAVEQSLRTKHWGSETPRGYVLRGKTIPETMRECERIHAAWTGPKLEIEYESLRRAVALFKL